MLFKGSELDLQERRVSSPFLGAFIFIVFLSEKRGCKVRTGNVLLTFPIMKMDKPVQCVLIFN